MRTHFIQNLVFGVGDLHGLLVHPILLVQLDALGPVVEGAGDDDLLGSMRPVQSVHVSTYAARDKGEKMYVAAWANSDGQIGRRAGGLPCGLTI